VYVAERYEGFDALPFPELDEAALGRYLDAIADLECESRSPSSRDDGAHFRRAAWLVCSFRTCPAPASRQSFQLDVRTTTPILDARSPCGALLSSEPTIQPAGNIGAHVRAPVQSTKMEDSSERRQKDASAVALTRGQVNAVRAAFKAGIKRSRIARQFGISQSDVRKVLASEFRESGRG
jgi:hypothetical protein